MAKAFNNFSIDIYKKNAIFQLLNFNCLYDKNIM